jgi:hypothetical protein
MMQLPILWLLTNSVQVDRWQRHELNYAVVEFVAPQEYMVRPPQPLCVASVQVQVALTDQCLGVIIFS